MARQVLEGKEGHYFDMEDPAAVRVLEQPMSTLEKLGGLVVIDEAQRVPELFPVLRVLSDRVDVSTKFLLLGSASPALSRQSNESLAGRVEVIHVNGFSLMEVGENKRQELWLRGGFPRSLLAAGDHRSLTWRTNFIRTFVERDLALLGFGFSPMVIGRFWTLLSHYHGQVWNASEAAATMGVTPKTVNRYLDALEETYMVRRLQPWHENVGKRLVKSPKIYLRDSGILHAQQRIGTMQDLLVHPKLGASWEGFVLEQVLSVFGDVDPYFYSVHSGTELDLFFLYNGERIGIEVKRKDAPSMTKGMHVALEDLRLDKLYVVYPGAFRYALAPRVECIPLGQVGTLA